LTGFFAKTRRGGAAKKIHATPSAGFFVLPMTGRRRLSRKIDWIFRQDEARRCSHTLCMAKRRNEVLAEKMSDGQRFYLS